MTTNYVKVDVNDPKVIELANKAGLDPKNVALLLNKENYRKAYAQRPDVKAARKAYTNERNAQLKLVAEMLKDVR